MASFALAASCGSETPSADAPRRNEPLSRVLHDALGAQYAGPDAGKPP